MNKIKVGDTVVVRSGKWRAKTGTVERILPSTGKAVVSGVNIQKRHQKKSARSPQGGIIERPAPLHLSKLMVVDPKTKEPSRIKFSQEGERKVRVTQSGEKLNPTVETKKASK